MQEFDGFARFREMIDIRLLQPGTTIVAGGEKYGMNYRVLPPEKRGKHVVYLLERAEADPRFGKTNPVNARDILKGTPWYVKD